MTDVLADQTPPLIHGPSDKEKKYDRQLRLWAANGQQALEEAHILLVNSGSGTVGVETLKNLVLPGIGKFTIADEAIVNASDLGVNFFLDEDCLGKSRAESCTKLLLELNPDVQGEWFPKHPGAHLQHLLQTDEPFTLIMYTHPIEPLALSLIEQYSMQNKVPVISIHSAGFYAYFQLHLPGNFPVVDTHPDATAITDLRLLAPWPELSAFASEITANIDELKEHEHGHIPYLILLLHYLEEWKKIHGGSVPSNYSEKTAFRKFVGDAAWKNNPEGGEENYDEAVAAVLKTISPSALSSAVREVFDYTPASAEAESSFWVITEAVKEFHAKHGVLPLPGSVPDMKAQSKVFVQLQNIYKKKAREDAAEVLASVRRHVYGHAIPQDEVEIYCKNAAYIKLIKGASQIDLKALAYEELNAEFAIQPSCMPVYLALRGSETGGDVTYKDILNSVTEVFPTASEDERLINVAQEVARAHGGELQNISSLVGGMVAQEIIKIITKQYIPIDNTCVFDGVSSRSQIFRL